MTTRKLSTERPVRGRVAAIEQAGFGEKERAAAEAGDAAAALGGPAEPGDEALVAFGEIQVVERAHDQRIDRSVDALVPPVAGELEPGPRADDPGLTADDLHGVGRTTPTGRLQDEVGGLEDVERADQVDRFRAGHRQQHDAKRLGRWGNRGDPVSPSHASLLSQARHGGNANHPWNPAMRDAAEVFEDRSRLAGA